MVIALAGVGGWFFGRNSKPGEPGAPVRKVAYYQSSMHPWIKSDQPGTCTICGMKLTPVFEGEKGFTADSSVITLSSNSIQVIQVQTEQAQVRPIERTLRVAGRIETDETRLRAISAYVDGRIDQLFVNFTGADVQAGEPLAMLYSPSLLVAEREYLNIAAQTNTSVSETLKSQHGQLLEGARQRLKRLGLSDAQISELRPGNSTHLTTMITAPMSGTVITRSAVAGQYVKEGDKLFEIADLSTMWFRFEVYERDLPLIQVGETIRVTAPALGSRMFEGVIAFIEPSIQEQTRSARVRVELQNPILEENGKSRRSLYNGLYAEGSIMFKTEPVLAVRRGVVLQPGDGARVYIDQGAGAYEHRPVKIGRQGDEFIEVLEGLSEGDRVVSSGNLLLDSEAQILRASSPAAPAHPRDAHSVPVQNGALESIPAVSKLSQDQAAAVKGYLLFISALNEHLAADHLDRYNEVLPRHDEAASQLAAHFPADSAAGPQVMEMIAEGKKHKRAPDLASARSQHQSFSKATMEFFRTVKSGGIDAVIYKCPMYPKLGQNAFWVQAAGPLRNPFFGSEMLECGVEVK